MKRCLSQEALGACNQAIMSVAALTNVLVWAHLILAMHRLCTLVYYRKESAQKERVY